MIKIGNKKITGIYIKVGTVVKRLLLQGKTENQIRNFIIYSLKKYLEYQFNETTSSNRSNTFTLNDLISIDEITVDNGSVTYSIDENKVTVSVSDGNSRSEYDSTKYSKSASEYKTSGTDSFSSNMNYNSDGYSGTLSKDGNSYVSSGSYTPSSSKTITDYKTSSTDSFPSSVNKDGYTLDKDGNSYVSSGSYTPSDSKVVTDIEAVTITFKNGTPDRSLPGSINYNKDGYSGVLTELIQTIPTNDEWIEYIMSNYTGTVLGGVKYKGTVTRPASDTRVYRQDYKKVINIPSSDTRVYRQNYKGYVYKGGYNYYYKYKINIKYTIKN